MNGNFEIGKTYRTRLAGDHTMTMDMTVQKRTATTLTVLTDEGRTVRAKIRGDECGEFIILGAYSMAPVFRASSEVA